MKRGRDGEKLMGPLFPRLHINDAEKGGPRAPPRNKMALYEQFSVPSQRLTSASTSSISPLLPNPFGNVVPSTSSSQGGGHSSTLFSLFFNPPASPRLDEGLHSSSSSGLNLNTTSMNLEWPQQPVEPPTTSRNLATSSHLCLTTKGGLFQPHGFSNTKNSSVGGKHEVFEDDYRVPIFSESGKNPQQNKDKEKVSDTSMKSPRHNQTSNTEILANQTSENPTGTQRSQEQDEVLEDSPSSEENVSDPGKNHISQDFSAPMKPEKSTNKIISSTVEGLSSLGNNQTSPHSNDSWRWLPVENIDKNEELPKELEPSIDSIFGLNISPDDVVGVLGQKEFWKARRTIVNQQRVFALQVFELHRLLKVQKSIAGSPNLLLEDGVCMEKSTNSQEPVSKNSPSEFVPEPRALIVKPKEDLLRPNITTPEFSPELSLGTTRVSSLNVDSFKGCLRKSGSPPPPLHLDAADIPAPWYFPPPPGNQWLIPVMSPSEGLVYKPCTGPCPPSSGFMAPIYGDYANTGYTNPPPHAQRIGGQNFFPPYGTAPITNNPSSASDSAVEQKTPFGKNWSHGQEKRSLPHQSSFNMSFGIKNSQASKESEVQGSTASSPPEKAQGDVLPLFPTAPTARESDEPSESRCSERQSQVIKVVPHNPLSASESVARIFQSIQEERKRYDQIISRTENACN